MKITLLSLSRNASCLATALLVSVCGFPAESWSDTYTVNTTTLNSYDNTHPRLLLDSNTISTIQSNIANPPAGTRWGSFWTSYKKNADLTAPLAPQPYITPPNGQPNQEQLEQRNTGDNMCFLAMASLLSNPAFPTIDTQWYEAEDATLVSPMVLQPSDATASGDASIGTPVGQATNPGNTSPSAVYNVNILKPATYIMSGRG